MWFGDQEGPGNKAGQSSLFTLFIKFYFSLFVCICRAKPDFVPSFSENQVNTSLMAMESDFLTKEWEWVYDPTSPSNSSVVATYDPATTTTDVRDFFVLSPNLESVSVKGHHLGFANSDHNPVTMQVKLR